MNTAKRLSPISLNRITFILLVGSMLLVMNSNIYAHGWKAPDKDAKIKNPVLYSKDSIAKGQKNYFDLCSNCHGENAGGGNPGQFKGKMTPPNLVNRLKGHSDGDFFWKIQTGRGGMPSFKEDVEPEEIWDIINFIRSLSLK